MMIGIYFKMISRSLRWIISLTERKHPAKDGQGSIKPIATALSKSLDQDTKALSLILDPDDPPSTGDLATRVQDLNTSITTSRSQTSKSRQSLTQEATKLHATYRKLVSTSIRILEQTIHGSVARGTKAKADYLATVAEGMSKKLGVQHGQLMVQLYSPEVQDTLVAKRTELEGEIKGAKRRVREAEEKLEEYEATGGMEGLAREYAEVFGESERVKMEVGRLKGV